jgi:predicted nucleotidyltransferase
VSDGLPPVIAAKIQTALDAVEREERVGIVFAIESGSRAWGFPSPDSDWDLRFVYARPTRWHLRLDPGRDVIERSLPDDIDLAGWDARKALNLLLGGNTALREWLASPIIYRAEPVLFGAFRRLAAAMPARASAAQHYRHLTLRVTGRYLRETAQVNLKKYLYAIRPVLALRWLRQNAAGEPPMDLPGLLAGVSLDAATRADLDSLLARKAQAAEIGHGDRLPRLDALIADELAATPETRPDHGAAHADAAQALMEACTGWADGQLARHAA